MAIELRVPSLGESITEVFIGEWRKQEGAQAASGENLVEIESDKATVELAAPQAGVVTKILKKKGETAAVGEVIGYMEAGTAAATPKTDAPAGDAKPTAPSHVTVPDETPIAASSKNGPAAEARVMPAAAREMAQRGLQPSDVAATGPGGRILKEDVVRQGSAPAKAPAAVATVAPPPAPAKSHPVPSVGLNVGGTRQEEAVPMSPIRRRIAQRLVEAQHSAALLTTFTAEHDRVSMHGVRRELVRAHDLGAHRRDRLSDRMKDAEP